MKATVCLCIFLFFCLSFCLSVFLSLFLFWENGKTFGKNGKKGQTKLGLPRNLSGTQGNALGNTHSTFDPPQTPYQGIFHFANSSATDANPSAGKHRENCRGRRRTNRHHNSNAHYCKKTANHELSLTSGNSQNSMVVQQRLKISELQFNKFQTLSSFSCWKIKIQDRGEFSFRFSLGCCVMDQRSGDGRFIGRIKIFARIFQILSCSTRELLSALNRIIQNSHFKTKVSLEEQKAQKEDRFSFEEDRSHT